MNEWLYRYEAKGIQSYILSTERLAEMMGASSLVQSLEGLMKDALPAAGAKPLVAAAGHGIVRFESREALETFASRWPMLVARHAPGLRIVQAWVALDRGSDDEGRRELFLRLAVAKNTGAEPDLPEAGPYLARAGRTGLAAVRRGKHGLEDRATARKAKQDRDLLEDRLRPSGDRSFLADLDQFGEGYVAVIHADGNGVGARLAREPLAKLGEFSELLSQATEAAARAAVEEFAKRSGGDGPILLRTIVLGGDDFTVIAPASDAIPFADFFLSKFEQETGDKGIAFSACAGIALVKPGFPFHQAHDLAEDLCRAAKEALRGLGKNGGTPSGVLFHRVTTACIGDWDMIRQTELVAGALSGGPWRTEDNLACSISMLRELARAMSALPKGAVREWARLVQADRSRAQAHWSRARDVLRGRDPMKLKKLDEAFVAIGADPETGWVKDGSTAILDAATWRGMTGDEPALWGRV